MNPPAQIIHQLLIDLGHAEESDGSWPAFISFSPDTPHESIVVYDTSGIPDGRIMDGPQIEHPGIQIRVRGRIYADVWQKANDIATALDTQGNILIALDSGAAYVVHNVSRTGTIVSDGIDEKDGQRRHYFTINAAVTIPNLEDFVAIVTQDGSFEITENGKYLITN